MERGYTDEKNILILIALLKAHGIRKVIVSPGATNVSFVGSIQYDPWFELYSCVDERSAAYMACGLAYESGEPVCLSCTGATASRNYMPGLTEAFYRKLPILVITSSQHLGRVGQLVPQVTDRSNPPKDVVKFSAAIPPVHTSEDEWSCMININKAILELKRHGGGPAHLNVITTYSTRFNVKALPHVNAIQRIMPHDPFPELPKGRIGIFVGSHKRFSKELEKTIDDFCEAFNGVVFCDHTSGYHGKFKVLSEIIAGQRTEKELPDLMIHIGEVSGAYYSFALANTQVWRVSEDGEIKDPFKRLTKVFEMPEKTFFERYLKNNSSKSSTTEYYYICRQREEDLRKKIPELPFSNIWLAQQVAHQLPEHSVVHFGILNSLRSWNFFRLPESVESISNVGGFGIDGPISTLLGASLANKNKLYFLVTGDLAFFYDINALGNRHVGNNIRILLVNNGRGMEFRNYNHRAQQFGEEADWYIAAAGHFGNQSPNLVKHFVQNLGFEYFSASDKDEFLSHIKYFVDPSIGEKPIVFEVFTKPEDESKALEIMLNLDNDLKVSAKDAVKSAIKTLAGDKGIDMVKKLLKK
jgi:2-succinyl-5-enolpyruvyl-6-hydroxy-3-cyclohexene-1-carboxylate synthase